MRCVVILGLVLPLWLGAAPLLASSVKGQIKVADAGPCVDDVAVASGIGEPFGFLDGTPEFSNSLTGVESLLGWALDDDGVAAVDVLVDGQVVGRAEYGLTRPDVAKVFPGFPDGVFSGWQFYLDTTNFLNGFHVVSAQVISNAGEVQSLNSQVLQFNNLTHNLRPFGTIDFPNPNADLFGQCDLSRSRRRFTVVTGWALDAGVENNDHGVGYVELLLDGTILANTRRDCVHSPVTGAHSNCYGQRRLDVERRYETLKDAPNAGFRFVFDVGELITARGHSEGHHTLTVRVGDIDSQVSNIDSINVNFFCEDFRGDRGAFGSIDESPEIPLASGQLTLTGWALDPDGVDVIQVFVDGEFVGLAAYGFPREVVTARYPGFPNSQNPGWIINIDTRQLAEGPHSVQVLVRDLEEHEDIIGEIEFRVKNR